MERKYEILVLLKHDSPSEKTQSVLTRIEEIITTGGGTVLDVDNWGKKKLAYEVKKQNKGIYVLFLAVCPPSLIQEIERNLRLNQEVLKFLSVKLDEKVDMEAELAKAAERQAEREARQAEREAAESEATKESEEKESAKKAEAEQKKEEEPKEEPAPAPAEDETPAAPAEEAPAEETPKEEPTEE